MNETVKDQKTETASDLKRLLAEEGTEEVFEVVDYTNDEMYYPLGMFPSLESAIAHIEKSEKKDKPISWHKSEEFETIAIIKRKFGWTENGFRVLEIKREEYYNEEADEYLWRRMCG